MLKVENEIFQVTLCEVLTCFTHNSGVFNVNFEQLNILRIGRDYVNSVRIRSYFGPHFPAFGLNAERYGVSLRIQSKFGKTPTKITRNTDTFHAVGKIDSE